MAKFSITRGSGADLDDWTQARDEDGAPAVTLPEVSDAAGDEDMDTASMAAEDLHAAFKADDPKGVRDALEAYLCAREKR